VKRKLRFRDWDRRTPAVYDDVNIFLVRLNLVPDLCDDSRMKVTVKLMLVSKACSLYGTVQGP